MNERNGSESEVSAKCSVTLGRKRKSLIPESGPSPYTLPPDPSAGGEGARGVDGRRRQEGQPPRHAVGHRPQRQRPGGHLQAGGLASACGDYAIWINIEMSPSSYGARASGRLLTSSPLARSRDPLSSLSSISSPSSPLPSSPTGAGPHQAGRRRRLPRGQLPLPPGPRGVGAQRRARRGTKGGQEACFGGPLSLLRRLCFKNFYRCFDLDSFRAGRYPFSCASWPSADLDCLNPYCGRAHE